MKVIFTLVLLIFSAANLSAQSTSLDSLKRAVTQLDQDLYQVQLHLHQSQSRLRQGIVVATLGYTVTIIGGQLLGTRPKVGETLLYVGGATGLVGTVILFRGFKKISLGPPLPRRS
jgi:hypothetical protein